MSQGNSCIIVRTRKQCRQQKIRKTREDAWVETMEKTSNDKIMNEDDDDEADATELTMMADGIIKWSSGTIREEIEGKVRSFLKAKVYSELKFVPDETFATILLKKAVRQHVIFKFAEKVEIDMYAKKITG